jgi:ribosome silencing factor RsfS/YbeB/iojap
MRDFNIILAHALPILPNPLIAIVAKFMLQTKIKGRIVTHLAILRASKIAKGRFLSLNERLERIALVLDQNKAERIEKFNLDHSDYMVSGVVIASALADRHLTALLDYLKRELKPLGEEFLHVDTSDEWVVIDLGDILVHIMTEKARDRYNLESFLDEFKKRRSEK